MSPSRLDRPPSVERVLAAARPIVGAREHAAIVAAARAIVATERADLAAGRAARSVEDLAGLVAARLEAIDGMNAAGLVVAVNATGVILHTNLGRAPWADAAIRAALEAAARYSLLELDRSSGRRGHRFRAAEDHLMALTGAEDALVTNNNATALALAVGLAGRGGVVVSRGELVEIGGGVRIPEIVRRTGARLVEVGTTNRTRAQDYEAPLVEGRASVVLRVHPSNFTMAGFTETPAPAEVADLAHAHGAIVVDDLGSGALLDTAAFGLAHEPMPSERLAAGADCVTFSGDKLVGGPQAGLIVGRADLIARLRRDPLARATRPDKVTLAAMSATLALYRAGRATAEIPVWRMIAVDPGALRVRAERLAGELPGAPVEVVALDSTVGGGSLPGGTLPSAGLALGVLGAERFLARLRDGEPAVVARVANGRVLIDMRTVDPAEDGPLAGALARALAPFP